MALGGAPAQSVLEEERDGLSENATAQVKREWIEDAIQQIQDANDLS